jgi:HEAT repeat protein
MRAVCLVALMALFALGQPALADRRTGQRSNGDRVAANVRQLEDGNGQKVRLSAALWLARTRDPRAIKAMVRAVQVEPVRAVRRVAAVSLGKMVDEGTPGDLRDQAVKALHMVAERDRDSKVRRNARESLARIERLPAPAGTRRPGGARVFVHVGKPKDLTKTGPDVLPRYLHDRLVKSLRKHAPEYRLRWPGGGLPTQADLQQHEAQGYFVGASVVKLRVQRLGNGAEVQCSVAMHVNAWKGSDTLEKWSEQEAASATGNGKVMSAYTPKDIDKAKCECVLAVAEQVTERQVVPFLRRLVAAQR